MTMYQNQAPVRVPKLKYRNHSPAVVPEKPLKAALYRTRNLPRDLPSHVRTKRKGVLDSFLSTKEPSANALKEYAAQLDKTGSTSGVSDLKLPDHVPKVNSRWNGMPDCASRQPPNSSIFGKSRSQSGISSESSTLATLSAKPSRCGSSKSAHKFSAPSTESVKETADTASSVHASDVRDSPHTVAQVRLSCDTVGAEPIGDFATLQDPTTRLPLAPRVCSEPVISQANFVDDCESVNSSASKDSLPVPPELLLPQRPRLTSTMPASSVSKLPRTSQIAENGSIGQVSAWPMPQGSLASKSTLLTDEELVASARPIIAALSSAQSPAQPLTKHSRDTRTCLNRHDSRSLAGLSRAVASTAGQPRTGKIKTKLKQVSFKAKDDEAAQGPRPVSQVALSARTQMSCQVPTKVASRNFARPFSPDNLPPVPAAGLSRPRGRPVSRRIGGRSKMPRVPALPGQAFTNHDLPTIHECDGTSINSS